MHDFLSLAGLRQSTRSYSSREVPRQLVEECLEAARMAPSACNTQPWRFIAADDPAVVEQLRNSAVHRGMNRFAREAPIIVAIFSEGGNLPSVFAEKVKGIPYHFIDIGIAAEHFCLAAAERGLGTCMIGWFDKRKAVTAVGAPSGSTPVLLVTLGYPRDDKIREKKRKPLDRISGWNSFS